MADPLCRSCGGTGHIDGQPNQNPPPTKDCRLFGTKDFPLHASAIPELLKCPWKLAFMYLFAPSDEAGPAADTGSATHVAVAHWHKNKELAAAIGAMQDASARYPQADLQEAAAMFLLYTKDPRNQEAEIYRFPDKTLFVERRIEFTLRAAPEDITQAPIHIVGTIDQVRVANSQLFVWDLKTSKKPGWDQLQMYLYQLATYAIGASALLQQRVAPGGLITTRHYGKQRPETSPSGIFWHYALRWEHLETLIDYIRYTVADIRAGLIRVTPGDHCRYCPAKGIEECLPLLASNSDQQKRLRRPIA